MLPAANQVGWSPETNRNPPSSLLCLLFLSFSRNERSWEGGGLRKIETYSREEERRWLRHKPKAMSPLFCVHTELFLPLCWALSLFYSTVFIHFFWSDWSYCSVSFSTDTSSLSVLDGVCLPDSFESEHDAYTMICVCACVSDTLLACVCARARTETHKLGWK